MGARRCYVCKTKADKERRIVLHSFDRKSHQEEWLRACGININYVDVSRLLICTNHFTIDDYTGKVKGGRLIDSAVPSIGVPYPPIKYIVDSQPSYVQALGYNDTITIDSDSTFETGMETDNLKLDTSQGLHTVWLSSTNDFIMAEDSSSNSILPTLEETSHNNVDNHFDAVVKNEVTEEVWIKESPVASPVQSEVVDTDMQYDPLEPVQLKISKVESVQCKISKVESLQGKIGIRDSGQCKISKGNVEEPLGVDFWKTCSERWKELAEKKVKDVKYLEEENRRLTSKVDLMQATIESLERKLAENNTVNFEDPVPEVLNGPTEFSTPEIKINLNIEQPSCTNREQFPRYIKQVEPAATPPKRRRRRYI